MNFWDIHGCCFIIFMFLFPRLTMLIMGICFMPFYWNTNPVLCILAWVYAFSVGSTSNKITSNAAKSYLNKS